MKENIDEIYAISDYVLRGDPLFGLGRSMLEGLYAGCNVLVPGTKADLNSSPELAPFLNKIQLYTPGSVDDLAALIESRKGQKAIDRKFESNCLEYQYKFERFVSSVIRE